MVLALVALGFAPLQEAGLATLDKLVEAWKSEDPEERDRALGEVLRRWKEWTADDLARIDRAAKDADAEVAAMAKKAAVRIRVRQRLGEKLLDLLPGLDAACAGGGADLIQALARARELWRLGKLTLAEAAVAAEVGRFGVPPKAEELLDLVGDAAAGVAAGDPFESLILPLVEPVQLLEVRRRAVEMLGRIGSRASIARMVKLFEDEEPQIRAQAVTVVGWLGARDHLDRVAALLGDTDSDVRGSAALALGRLGGTAHAEKLLPLLSSAVAVERRYAAFALEDIGTPKCAEALRGALKDSDSFTRVAAAWTLIRRAGDVPAGVRVLLEDEEAWGGSWHTGRFFREPSFEAVCAAAAAHAAGGTAPGRARAAELWCRLDARAQASACAKLLADEDASVRRAAVRGLGAIGSAADVEAVARTLADADAEVREAACRALASLGGPVPVEELVKRLTDPSERVRRAAWRAVYRLVRAEDARLFQALLEHEDAKVRIVAADVLGMLPSDSVEGMLLALLKDSDEEVRRTAIESLGNVGGKRARGELRALTSAKEPSIRGAAVHSLALLAGTDALDVVIERVDDDDPGVRGEALRAAAMLRARQAVPKAVARLDDADERVRDMALQALGRAGAIEYAERMRRALKLEDANAAADAFSALVAMRDPGSVEALIDFAAAHGRIGRNWTLQELGRFLAALPAEQRPAAIARLRQRAEGWNWRIDLEMSVLRVRLGEGGAAEHRELIDDVYLHDERGAAQTLSEALCAVHDRETYARLSAEFATDRRVATPEDVRAVLAGRGFRLELEGAAAYYEATPAGVRTTMLDLLDGLSLEDAEALLLTGDTVRLVKPIRALRHWRTRLTK